MGKDSKKNIDFKERPPIIKKVLIRKTKEGNPEIQINGIGKWLPAKHGKQPGVIVCDF